MQAGPRDAKAAPAGVQLAAALFCLAFIQVLQGKSGVQGGEDRASLPTIRAAASPPTTHLNQPHLCLSRLLSSSSLGRTLLELLLQQANLEGAAAAANAASRLLLSRLLVTSTAAAAALAAGCIWAALQVMRPAWHAAAAAAAADAAAVPGCCSWQGRRPLFLLLGGESDTAVGADNVWVVECLQLLQLLLK